MTLFDDQDDTAGARPPHDGAGGDPAGADATRSVGDRTGERTVRRAGGRTHADADAEAEADDDADGGEGRVPGRRRRRRRGSHLEPPTTGAAAQDREPDAEEVARTIALRKLTAAPQSRATLETAMVAKDVPEDVARRVLDRFTEVGLVDDAAYAEMLVRTRHAERGLARRALVEELRRKGIDRDTAAAALEQIDDNDEWAAALEVARRKARATAGLDTAVRKRRMVATLGRKGFGPGVSYRAVDEALREDESGDEDRSGPPAWN